MEALHVDIIWFIISSLWIISIWNDLYRFGTSNRYLGRLVPSITDFYSTELKLQEVCSLIYLPLVDESLRFLVAAAFREWYIICLYMHPIFVPHRNTCKRSTMFCRNFLTIVLREQSICQRQRCIDQGGGIALPWIDLAIIEMYYTRGKV